MQVMDLVVVEIIIVAITETLVIVETLEVIVIIQDLM